MAASPRISTRWPPKLGRAGEERRRLARCTRIVSSALQTPGRWTLELRMIAVAIVEIGAGVDVDVADSRRNV